MNTLTVEAYSNLFLQASVNNDLLMAGTSNSDEPEKAFATS